MSDDMLELAKNQNATALEKFDHRGEPMTPEMTLASAQTSALIALAEQAKRLADSLNSIDAVLTNASGASGALQVHSYTFDGERY